ncbi:hypothetical protein HDU96_005008, partial [Phlyctochytrium bullatum]
MIAIMLLAIGTQNALAQSSKAAEPMCIPYNGTVCSGVVTWTVLASQFTQVEDYIKSQTGKDSFKTLSSYTPKCSTAWKRWLCTNYFQDCGNSVNVSGQLFFRKPCSSPCNEFLDACSPVLQGTNLESNLQNCSLITIPDPQTSSNPSTSNSERPLSSSVQCYGSTANLTKSIQPKCPSPLVPKPTSLTDKDRDYSICLDAMDCCLGCPALESFYPSDILDTTLRVLGPIRIISVILGTAVFVSYLVLPDKRTHPRVMVLFVSFDVMAFQLLSIFPTFGNRQELLCANAGRPG